MGGASKKQYFEKADLKSIPKKPGVYTIYSTGSKGRIRRLKEDDTEGILCYGETTDLHRRLHNQFWKVVRDKGKARHSAAKLYMDFSYGKEFPINTLQFDFEVTGNKADAKEKESELLHEYRERFLDNPPLNRQLGSFSHKRESR